MKNLLISIIMMSAVSVAHADPSGHWYNPDKPGYGIQINRDGGFGHAVTWYLYRKDSSSAFLVSMETCDEFPCVVSLAEPTARFLNGDAELGDAVGSVEFTPLDNGGMRVDYDLRLFLGEECLNIGGGGLLLRGCLGKFDMIKLAD